jgi:acetyltransferase-like isoleucine patch superfamily enzyme
VGTGCRIITREFGTEPFLIRIGDRVTVADGVRFLTHDGAHWLIRDDQGRRYRYAPIEIGDDVFVGAGATLMPGVRIGSRCIVAAGAVVTKSVPTGTVVAGVPAAIIGLFDEFEAKSLAQSATDAARQRFAGDMKQWVSSIAQEELVPELSVRPDVS